MTVNTEDIYRAMGWTPCEHKHKHAFVPPEGWHGIRLCRLLPDPLTDWSAFGEILEWAAEQGHVAQEEFWLRVVTKLMFGADFREAFLARLSEAVRE